MIVLFCIMLYEWTIRSALIIVPYEWVMVIFHWLFFFLPPFSSLKIINKNICKNILEILDQNRIRVEITTNQLKT